jgi:hypothetical protein
MPIFIVCFTMEKYSSTLNVIIKRSIYVRICDQFHLIAYLSSFIVSFSMKNYSPKMIAQLIKDTFDLFITQQLALYLVYVIIHLTLAARSSLNWRGQWSRSFKNGQTKICKLGAYIVLIKLNARSII